MVGSEYSMDIYKSVKIGTVMKNPQILISIPDNLKTKKYEK